MMMKLILTIVLLFNFTVSYNGVSKIEIVYDDVDEVSALLCAMIQVESNGNPMAVNGKENARGILQIRPIRLKDYNARTGSSYVLDQMHVDSIAIKVFMHYATGTSEQIARKWNGGANGHNKECTLRYWMRVSKIMMENS